MHRIGQPPFDRRRKIALAARAGQFSNLNAVVLIAIPARKVFLQAQKGQHLFVPAKIEARGTVQGRVVRVAV